MHCKEVSLQILQHHCQWEIFCINQEKNFRFIDLKFSLIFRAGSEVLCGWADFSYEFLERSLPHTNLSRFFDIGLRHRPYSPCPLLFFPLPISLATEIQKSTLTATHFLQVSTVDPSTCIWVSPNLCVSSRIITIFWPRIPPWDSFNHTVLCIIFPFTSLNQLRLIEVFASTFNPLRNPYVQGSRHMGPNTF